MKEFERKFELDSQTTILDVGGAPGTWDLIHAEPQVVLLNLSLPDVALPPHISAVVGSGTALPFSDKTFDIVFSNSVIEHVYTWKEQQRFGSEIRRVGRSYSVQTPNRRFPIEPHYLTPAIHYLPKNIQRRLIRNFTIRGWITRPDATECAQMVNEIRLLSEAEMMAIFPESTIKRESFLGLTKSLTAEYQP